MWYVAPPDFSWLSYEWFLPSVFLSYEWQHPEFLYLLPLVPVLFLLRWIIASRLRRRIEVAMFGSNTKHGFSSLLRFIPGTLFSGFVFLVIIALARPQRSTEQIEIHSEGIDIVLVMDVSASMEIEDFKPTRLQAAKNMASGFINGRVKDRIGLVVFAGEAFSLVPLTTDYELVLENLAAIEPGIITADGTAIGNSLAVAINRLNESESKSKVAILLSDGENTAGALDPATAAHLAFSYGIKLYTIGVGQDGRVPYGRDEEGNQQYVDTRLDETTLRSIAEIGKGSFFRATGNEDLKAVFSEIDKLEKTVIEETRYKDTKDFYTVYLTWAIVLFLFWMMLKNTFMTNALED